MVQDLTHLHDTHDGRLYQQLSVFFDVLMRGFLFNLQFSFQWDVDVDAEFFAAQMNFTIKSIFIFPH